MNNSSDQSERRRHPRTQLQLTLPAIRLEPEDGGVLDSLDMVDISKSGMGAFSDRQYYPGQRIALCLPVTVSGGRRNVYATIVRCKQRPEGYRIGLEFDAVYAGAWCGVSTVVAAA